MTWRDEIRAQSRFFRPPKDGEYTSIEVDLVTVTKTLDKWQKEVLDFPIRPPGSDRWDQVWRVRCSAFSLLNEIEEKSRGMKKAVFRIRSDGQGRDRRLVIAEVTDTSTEQQTIPSEAREE